MWPGLCGGTEFPARNGVDDKVSIMSDGDGMLVFW